MGTTVRDDLVGRVVDGRYRVVSRLARGGMATVYDAVDLRLDRTVALKVMHAALAEDPGFVERFRREAKAAARLTDPHVVAVYDQGQDGDLVYLVMEYVPGRTVRDVLRDHGPLTPEQALVVLEPVLEALGAAHAAGFVHRDVKPENVLISDDGRIKVADFGLARAVSGSTSSVTQGMLIGTVAYLSPEQVERGVADPRSDVYGAGILLYEMVTGQVPFAGETPLAVAYQHVHGTVPAPSSVRPGLPADVDALVAAATRRDPDHRYPDAPAFLADVRRVRPTLPPPRPFAAPRDTLVVTSPLPPAHPAPPPATPHPAAAPAAPAAPGPHRPRGSTRRGPGTPAEPGSARRRSRRPRRAVVVGVVAVLLAALGAGVAGWWFASGPGKRVPVPGVVGIPQSAAQADLEAAGLAMEVGDPQFSETVARDLVLSTDPPAGDEVPDGSTVTVVLSLGPERFAVPVLRGATPQEAADRLTEVNLVVGRTTRAYDEEVGKGLVVRSDPEAGAKLRRDSAVDLVVSKGPKPVPVPDVVGTSRSAAAAALKKAGLKVTVTEEYSSSVPTGQVMSVDPAPGTVVNKGTTVALVVSKGPPPVEVPNVVDSIREDAIAALEAAGLRVRVEEGIVTPLNRVYSQDPPGGTVVPRGTTVTIQIF